MGDLLKQKQTLENDLRVTSRMCHSLMSTGANLHLTDPLLVAPSLSLRNNAQYGLYVHIGKAKRDLSLVQADPEFIEIARSNTTRAYFHKVRHYFICFSRER